VFKEVKQSGILGCMCVGVTVGSKASSLVVCYGMCGARRFSVAGCVLCVDHLRCGIVVVSVALRWGLQVMSGCVHIRVVAGRQCVK